MRQIEALLFDLDGTLIEYQRSPGEVLRASFDTIGSEPLFAVEEYYTRFEDFAQQTESMEELRAECFATLASENGHTASQGRRVAEAFADERDQSRVEFSPGASEALEELGQAHSLAIVTNGAEDAQRQKIAAIGLERSVDTIVIAGQTIPPKPASEPFQRALQELAVESHQAIHIGDSLETDVAGAINAGLQSVWVSSGEPTGDCLPTYQINTL